MDEAPVNNGTEVGGIGGGGDGHVMGVEADRDRGTLVSKGRTPMGAEAAGPRVRQLDLRSGVEALVVSRGGLAGADSSGSGGGGGGDAQSGHHREIRQGVRNLWL